MLRVIVKQVARENVSIKSDHATRCLPALGEAGELCGELAVRGASFMSRTTGAGSFHAPAISAISRRFARMMTVPSVSNVNRNSSDGFKPNASRMSFGIVVWPLLVRVAVDIIILTLRNFVRIVTRQLFYDNGTRRGSDELSGGQVVVEVPGPGAIENRERSDLLGTG